jgi:TonB family protein
VLTHELAHITRFDWPVQMLAEIARAVYWFNPLFWFLCRRLRAESEHACDDAVLNTGISATDYATHLLELARTLRGSTQTWAPVLAMARPPHVERRFVAMLNPSINRKQVSRRIIFIAGILALLITLPIGAVRAGQDSKPAVLSEIVTVVKPAESPAPAPPPAVKRAAPRVKPVQGLADGSLSGTISDATGAVIPGVSVTVSSRTVSQNAVTETDVQTTTTNEVGSYEFRGLTPGPYIMKAMLPGFALFRSGALQITFGQNVVENATLSIGSMLQRVELTVAGQARPRTVSTNGPVRIRVGGNVVAARLITQVKPYYPEEAKEAGIEGIIHLQGFIGKDGTLIGLNATNNINYLSKAALEAVNQWRYSPSLLNNEPVQVPTSIDIEFKLEQ